MELNGYRLLLPEGTLDYFDLVDVKESVNEVVIYLEEKNIVPEKYTDQDTESKGFYDPIIVQDFPLRGKKVFLNTVSYTHLTLYANNKDEQYSYIEAAKNKGYNVLLMGGQLDVAMVSMLEQKFEKVRFTRVDSDVVDNLIVKEDKAKDVLEADKQEVLSVIFKSQLPQIEKTEFNVMAQALGENASPVMITQSEYMRRMKEMANIQAGMSFYGEMPDMFNLVLNADHKLVKEILADEDKECAAAVAPIQKEMDDVNTRRNELKKKQEGKKDEDIPTTEKDEVNDLDKKWEDLKNRKNGLFADYAAQNKVVRQLIDLALLQNGMLKGEALNNFVKRSIDLIK